MSILFLIVGGAIVIADSAFALGIKTALPGFRILAFHPFLDLVVIVGIALFVIGLIFWVQRPKP